MPEIEAMASRDLEAATLAHTVPQIAERCADDLALLARIGIIYGAPRSITDRIHDAVHVVQKITNHIK